VSRRILTIGAYGFEPDSFFAALELARVDVFLDIRQRRGLRGSRYAFANVTRLSAELQRRGIAYRHLKELAPDSETRDLQRQADESTGTLKSARSELAPAFVEAYTASKLTPFDWKRLAEELAPFQVPVLFCVERSPESCHRSLVAPELARLLGAEVVNLRP
jgi:uncharacterized protein (DUF488 family)